eukprot:TRINITY_DN7512_c0_g1_i1.p1 TRINITY_DN7512_c0_g1~~TRINITY_DN7512_c0_g1_i1.p1  ORF type:complete len:515 (-),score=147.48 TRINITY_DN7512_c0_g1_i1:133-1677(-)
MAVRIQGPANFPTGQTAIQSNQSFGKSLTKDQEAIIAAVERDRLDDLKALVEANPAKRRLALTADQLRFRDKNGRSLLHIACASSTTSKALMEYLLSKLGSEEDINDANDGKGTPLHLAANAPNLAAVKLLVERGADLRIKNAQNLNVLEVAQFKRSKALIKYLEEKFAEVTQDAPQGIENSASPDALPSASSSPADESKQDDDEFRKVLSGPISDWRVGTSEERERLLLEACAKGDLEGVQKLDELEVSYLCADSDGNQPLHLAAFSGSSELVRFLISKGVCRQPRNDRNWTPLHSACAGGSLSTVRFLAEEALLQVDVEPSLQSKGFLTNKKASQFLLENRDRLNEARDRDTSDVCCVCSQPLSYKFGDSLEAIPVCVQPSADGSKAPRSAIKSEREYFSYTGFVYRQFFDPLTENVSLYEMRFGQFKRVRCTKCKKIGMLCRCLSEKDDSGKIRNPHVPFMSTKISMLLVLSNNTKFGSTAQSPLNVLKDSILFDVNVLSVIFGFMCRRMS